MDVDAEACPVKIVVLIKEVPDTYGERRLDPATGRLDRESVDRVIDEIDERALEVALAHKDAQKDTEVVVLTMGPEHAKAALRKALSMGADGAVHVVDDGLAGSDALQTARVLAAAIAREGFDVVVAGNESTDGRGGVVPAMIAELLGIALLGDLGAVRLSEGGVTGTRVGTTATTELTAGLPALITVTERAAEPRFPNLKGIMTAKRKPLAILTRADLDVTDASAFTTVLTVAERPARSGGEVVTAGDDIGERLVAFLDDRKAV